MQVIEDKPHHVFSHEIINFSTSMRVPPALQQDKGCAGDISCFIADFADISLRLAGREFQTLTPRLRKVLTETISQMKTFKIFINILANCEDVSTWGSSEIIKTGGIERILAKDKDTEKENTELYT